MASRVHRRQKLDRVTNACERCKKRKVKCSGNSPCETCTSRGATCIFQKAEKKVIVSERYLRHLQECYTRTEAAHKERETSCTDNRSSPTTREVASPNIRLNEVVGEGPIMNPLVSSTSFYLRDTIGHYRFCGPSSTWSFSQRVFLMLKAHEPNFLSPELPFHVDGSIWELRWTRTTLDDSSMFEGLPSLNDMLYLLTVVKHHSCEMLFLVDEQEFMPRLHEFYEKGIETAKRNLLWFVQYLLIVALAKGLLAVSKSPGTPPGSPFFERAMSLMPEFVPLQRHPNLAMQVLILTCLYLVLVDMKGAAYSYIGQAIRMCIIEGLHREPPVEIFGSQFGNQCRNIWWTAYILDRQLSAMVGAPTSIQDAEITSSLPILYDNSESAKVLTAHVKLSRVVGDVLGSVYTADIGRRRSFISTIQSVLRDMAGILRDIEDISAMNAHQSLRTVSAVTSNLALTYHQCIVLATRPLFFYFLVGRLKKRGSHCERNRPLVSPQLKPLLETSLQSANFSLRTSTLLHEQSLLESLLPLNLDNIFSSAFIIIVASFIDPLLVPDMPTYVTAASKILDKLVSKGNLAAHSRRLELDLLLQMTQHIAHSEGAGKEDGRNNIRGEAVQWGQEETLRPGYADQLSTEVDAQGMTHMEILNLAEQLDTIGDSAWGDDFEFEYSNIWV
ncbi:hypothetical protein BDQ94DRAFT_164039 [Aspergillus welwitschiae]|uniref:Zn(2)-C6 fungal-type domain-containing protein n=1 Tax=Aspergillus welwitschiae TaxID=1341132 RepID=A0A3F3PKV1_9EURO|nr:hypothetical protein BDQ94DRAFT_164039 [Aspergillus welwitschiae]RDH26966.1 hypothetical protein BDQ94DRAFT_164039 [Aspergillus welwitschiae]